MKRFKKFLPFFLAVVLLLSSAPVDVHATEAGSETVISVESKSMVVGETVSVDVLIENNPGILGATLEFSFAEELTLVSASAGEAFSYLTMTKPAKFQSPCRFTWDGTDCSDEDLKDGTIVTLNFTVAEDVELEKALAITVNVPDGDVYDRNLNYVEVTTKDGSVTPIDFKPGDVNGDGSINITDVIMIRRYLVGYEIDINVNAANVNGDYKVNTADVILLRRYIAGGYDVIPLPPPVLICNHVMEETAYKAPTCKEEGVSRHWYCTECHKFYSDAYGNHEMAEEDTVIEKLAHTWVIIPQVDPTYDKEGSTEGKYCSVCGHWEKKVEPIPQLKKDEYSITYYISNNDSYLAGLNIENQNPTVYTKQDGLVLKDLVVDGYYFKGWYTSATGGTKVTELSPGTSGNQTLYAQWEEVVYKVNFDSPDVPVDSVTYTVSTGVTLTSPSWFGYTFVGWSNDDGFIVSRIKPGTTGNITLHANWTSNRNKATSYSKYDAPIVIEDDANGQFLFVYDIGKIENVPLGQIEYIGNTQTLNINKEYSITDTISSNTATTIANTVSNATTRSSGWTLAEEWEQIYSEGVEDESTKIKTSERTDSEGNVVGGNYFVSNSTGGSSYISTESGGSSASSSKVTTDTSKGINTSYDTSTEMYADAKLGVTNTTETGAGVSFPVEVVKVSAEVKNTTTVSAEVSSGRKDNSAFHVDTSESSYVGTVDTNDQSSYYNVSANQSSTWNSTSGYEKSYQTSRNTAVTEAISEAISEKTTYNLSKALGGANSTTESVAGTDTRSDEYSTTVNYSKGTSETTRKTITYNSDRPGYYRLVTAGTVHVYAVVGYDVATASYYTYTFNVLADETYEYLDYSKDNANFNDCENGLVTFEVPFEVCEYVSSVTGKTNGLEFDLDNGVTVFDASEDRSFDGTVVIPQYYSTKNAGDGTYSAYRTKKFDASVFAGNTEIKKVVLPMYITEIPDGAFEGCTNLEMVVAYGVTKIGDNAFKGCTSLNSFAVDNKITEIGNNAFEDVEELRVMAANAEVADATINSGAKKITLNISVMEGSYDNKEIVISDNVDYFGLISNGATYNNLRIKSEAAETYISNVNFANNEDTPLELVSQKVTLARVSVENAPGFAMILPADHTEVALYGTIGLSSLSENAVITKDVTLTKADAEVAGKLQVTGNYLICGTLKNEKYLSFGSGELKSISETEFINKLTEITITFDANGGNVKETSRVISRGAKIGDLPVPERTGYDFEGWYFEGGSQITSNTTFSTDTTVYARWNVKEYQAAWTAGNGKNITVYRIESPYADAVLGTVNSGDKVYYGDVLQIFYKTLDGWTIESHGAEEITVTKDVTSSDIYMTVWSNWSDWSTSAVSGTSNTAVETKTQYRYSDKNITTSTSDYLEGWTLYNTETVYGEWGAWYGWVEASAPAASDTCEVELSKFWRYYYLKCPQCGGEEGLYGTSDCGYKSLNSSHMVVGWSRTPYSSTGYHIYEHAAWKGVTNSNSLIQESIIGYGGITPGHTWYFNAPDESKQDVGAISGDSNDIIIRAFSRWRTRSKSLKYYHYKWSDWSEWSDTVYSQNDERKVETRTLYRYRTKY